MRMQKIEIDSLNMAAIRASLSTHGQVEPLVVQRSTRMVIAGNGRMAAMRELGWGDAQCVLLDVDDNEARRLSIVLNRSGELAGWNEEVLAKHLAELEKLAGDDFDLDGLGFDEDEMQALVDAYVTTDEELEQLAAPEPEGPPPGTQPTDMSSSGLRVVQLYLDPADEPIFQLEVRALAERYGTDNVTATIREAVRQAAAAEG